MKTKINIFFTLLLLTTLSCKGQAQKKADIPAEKFSIIETRLSDGRPAIGSFNIAYKNYSHKPKYLWCLKINMALELKNVSKNGLPIKAESDIANRYEDSLINVIKKIATVHYIGHLYNDSFLDIFIYLDDPEKVNRFLQAEVNKKTVTRQFAYEIKQDPTWSTVVPFLK
ncbi:DUF695 domain-containing protein [Mucilaginibacter aquariorum]|uniref:DUF695 domain-containing protein n=1 Tax=Mucilaginibacter aquariorum TaxID=2967225 RepID=A0ABT1T8B4_9SPHI|nr:DUF695 domain-containing protein [Mucilaginibacter aquariorum]MCQ6960837.1 DUF695 domain-containing protein [Mucilaginibacter aquariorum]